MRASPSSRLGSTSRTIAEPLPAQSENLTNAAAAALMSELRKIISSQEVPDEAAFTDCADRFDIAQRLAERQRQGSLASLQHVPRKRILAALQLVRTGEYGRCQDCDRTIPEERLRLVPDAVRCVPCQNSAERRSRSLGGRS